MAEEMSVEQIAEEMFKMVEQDFGKKKYKPTDVTKAMQERFGADRSTAKQALRSLIDSERLVYTYFGGTFVEIPHKEGAAPDSE